MGNDDFELYKKPEGFCPRCHQSYGVMIRSDTHEAVCEYSDCMCWAEENEEEKFYDDCYCCEC